MSSTFSQFLCDVYNFQNSRQIVDYYSRTGRDRSVESIIHLIIFGKILDRGGMPKLAKKIFKVAKNIEYSRDGNFLLSISHREKHRNEKQYQKSIKKFKKISSIKMHNFGVSDQILEKILLATYGDYNYHSGLQYVEDYVEISSLSDEECEYIAKNFKRLMHNKKMIQYIKKDSSRTI